jgi:hypothetical protein
VIAVELDLDHVVRVRERGWHGLGQALKSFRDTPVEFPVYAQGPAASPTFAALGPLERPQPERPDGRGVRPNLKVLKI